MWSTDVPWGSKGPFNMVQVCAAAKGRNPVVFSSVAFHAKAVSETLGDLELQDKPDLCKDWFVWKPFIIRAQW